MSFYVLIGAAIVEVIAIVATGIATGIVLTKAKQATDNVDKVTLRLAGTLLGLSILFVAVTMISVFGALAVRGCRKRKRWVLITAGILSGVSLLTALIIIFVTANKYQKANKTGDAQNLRGAGGTVLVALGLHLLAFILFWIIIGRRLARIGKACRQAVPAIGAAKAQVTTIQSKVVTA